MNLDIMLLRWGTEMKILEFLINFIKEVLNMNIFSDNFSSAAILWSFHEKKTFILVMLIKIFRYGIFKKS